ncbi:hypothetical protein N9954_06110 [Maribacter sp.]|nr:hypothetical protein [Maribacter sp.]
MIPTKFGIKHFITTTILVNIWVQVSETIRYLVFVVPRMETDAGQIPEATGAVLVIWIMWGTLLTGLTVFLFWMYAKLFGNSMLTILKSATISWAFVFVLFWIGISNMGLSDWSLLWITLPLSWLEIFVATYIASLLYRKPLKTQMT